MIAKILPLIRLPAHLDYFDYAVPEHLRDNLCIGQMVRIPFRKKTVNGIVIDIQKKTDAASLKNITVLCGADPVLTSLQKELLAWFSDFYFVSRATVCRMMFLPPRTRKQKIPDAKQFLENTYQSRKTIRLSPASISALGTAMKCIEKTKKPILFHCANEHEKIALYAKCARLAIEQKNQILIICPTISEAEYIAHRLSPYLSVPQLLLHGGLRISELRKALDHIQNTAAPVILGTRMALFHAIPYLRTIIIDQSERQEHKQYDMHPRYHAITVACTLAKKIPMQVILQSHAPRIEDMYAAGMGIYEYISLDAPHQQTPLIHLTQEEYIPAAPLISETLKEKISDQLFKKKNVFLFLNKKGLSSSVICQTCSMSFSCPTCKCEQAYSAKTHLLSCMFCHTSIDLPAVCPTCRGNAFFFSGIGSEKIASSLKKIFPGVSISEINKESHVITSENKPSIIIGTSFVPLSCPELFPSFGLVCILRADPIDSFSDFRSQEIQWQTLSRTLMLAQAEKCDILIQAFQKNHPFVSTLCQFDWTSFLQRELAQRKEYGWPPHSRLIAISYRPQKNHSHDAVKNLLLKLTGELDAYASISLLPKRSSHEHDRILITHSSPYFPHDSLSEKIFHTLKNLPAGFLVDIDPYMV